MTVEVGNTRAERISLNDDTPQEYSGLVVDLERPTLKDELNHAVQDGEREINGRQTREGDSGPLEKCQSRCVLRRYRVDSPVSSYWCYL